MARNFAHAANVHFQAVVRNPAIDPADRILLTHHPVLHDYGAYGIPGVPCPESCLRLALSLVQFGDSGISPEEMVQKPIPLHSRLASATVPQMQRRLRRLGIGDFPLYVALPVPPGTDPEFVLIDPLASRPRKDKWAIVYVPPYVSRQPPNPPMSAHWTFTTVEHVDFAQLRENRQPTIVYTPLPITDKSPRVYWRCKPTKSNHQAYLDRAELGLACHRFL